MKNEQIRTFDWIGRYRLKCKYDLSRNELLEQDLSDIGVRTAYEDYLKEEDPENYFKDTVAELYGVEKDDVIPTIGGTEAIFLASGFLGSISERILIPVPEYEPIFRVPHALGSNVVTGVAGEIAKLSSEGDSAMMTSPGNPEGLDRTNVFESLADVLGKDSRIYVDETFTEFRFRNKPDTLFHEDVRALVSGTMTKFFGLTKLRTGWILAHDDDRERIMRVKAMSSAANPKYPLWLAANVLGKREAFARTVRDIIQTNLPVADAFIRKFGYLDWKKPDSAPFGFVRYNLDIDSETLCKNVYEDTGILLVPGSYFGVEHGFRLCFFLKPDTVRDAFEILTEYFEERLSPMEKI